MPQKFIFTSHVIPVGQTGEITGPLNEDHEGPEWTLMYRPKEEVIPAKPAPVVLVTCIWGKPTLPVVIHGPIAPTPPVLPCPIDVDTEEK